MKTSAALVLSAISTASAFAPAANKASCTSLDAALPRETILSEPDTTEFGKIWDPLGLAEGGSDETIAWYRHSEIKHGRVAMAAFVGWWTVGAGVRFPGELAHGLDFASIPSHGLEAWDAVPGWGKAQMLLFAGLIELHDEIFFSRRGTHYMRGGTPGKVCMIRLMTVHLFFLMMKVSNVVPYFVLDLSRFLNIILLHRTWYQGFSIHLACPREDQKRPRPRDAHLRSRTDVLL